MTTSGATTTTTEPALPELEWFETHYGVPISHVGDEGDMVMLGHIPAHRATAAVRAYLRKLQGERDADRYLTYRLGSDRTTRRLAAERGMLDIFQPGEHRWAVVVRHCDRWPTCQLPDGDCGSPASCAEIAAASWCLKWDGVTADTDGAFPITYWAE